MAQPKSTQWPVGPAVPDGAAHDHAARGDDSALDDDPTLRAARAVMEAAATPMALVDAAGACVIANRAYTRRASRGDAGGTPNRAPFSPDGRQGWSLLSYPDAPPDPPPFDFMSAMANALPVMVNAKDRQGRYLFMNRYQADMYGVSAKEVVGRLADDVPGLAYGPASRRWDAEILDGGRGAVFYEENDIGADGVDRQWLTSKAPLLDAEGAVQGVATIVMDISDRRELERKLRAALDQAEASNRAKSRFLAVMSHELRTPLNAVIGFAELMEQEALGPLGSPDYREYAGHILRSGMRLLHMISNLLDFARVESGAMELSVGDVEMVRLLRSVTNGARADREAERAPCAPIRLELPAGQVAIRGDEQRLRQVLGGLVGNALKFTPAGGHVEVRLLRAGDGVEVQVDDSGIGMSEEELAHVFEPFWQADSGLGRARDGAGVGLKLARELVALHGGSLTLDSAKGRGTQVRVRLPHAPPAAAAA